MKKIIHTLILTLTISACNKQKCQTCTATYYDDLTAPPRIEQYENCTGYDFNGVSDFKLNPWRGVNYSNCSEFKSK